MYLEVLTGQQLQIGQMIEDLTVNFFTVQSIQPLERMHTESALKHDTSLRTALSSGL